MKVTVKAFQFMDKLFLTQKEVNENAKGWEHKESIKTVYLSIDQDDLMEIQNEKDTTIKIEMLEYADKQVFADYDQAEQETETENNF